MGCNLIVTKSSSTKYAVVSDILTYEVRVSNISDTIAENVVVKDLLPEELKFILGSIKVDKVEDTYSNIIAGVNLGDIKASESKTVTFKAQIIKKIEPYIENRALIEFRYQSKDQLHCDSCYSDVNKVEVKSPNLLVEKICDKKVAKLDDEINYKITITNNGDLDLYNIFLVDELPKSVELIDSTFSIDDKIVNSVELEKGVMLDNINIGEVKTINYKVKVVSGGCSTKIKNKVKVRYSYTLTNGFTAYQESDEVTCCIDITISSFKQISIDEYLPIPPQKPDIEEINEVKAYVKINKCNIIKTSKAKSSEGQILSGYKLVVHGDINQLVEYTACEPTQSVHSAHYNMPFSTYIVLPSDFKPGNKVDVEGIVEDIYFNKVNERCLFKNVVVLLLAKITCCN